MKKLLFLLPLLLIAACARQPQLTPPGSADTAWEAMQTRSAQVASAPFRFQFSLRFGSPGNTRRVTGMLWGNTAEHTRLDVQAGIGATLARAAEDNGSFILYAPGERKAWYREDSAGPIVVAGAPLPFNLAGLADLLCGRYGAVFGENFSSARIEGSDTLYTLDSPPGGILTITSAGLPVLWQTPDGWRLEITHDDEPGELPARLRLQTPDNQALFLVKGRDNLEAPFTEAQLALEIPASVSRLPMQALNVQPR